jgi:hypothetical protein
MKSETFMTVLFWVLLIIFVATAILILLALISVVQMEDYYKKTLFGALIVELVGCVFTFWKKLTASFSTPPDISGEWEYECMKEDELYAHGGVCNITIKKSEFGWAFTIQGKRTWIANRQKKSDNWNSEWLDSPPSWESNWGAFLDTNELRYGYTIQIPGKVILGYSFLNIPEIQNKKATKMEGNFYQLPPNDTFYGSEKYTRKVDSPASTNT